MSFLESLFSGAVSFVRNTLQEGKEFIQEAVHSIVKAFASEKAAKFASKTTGQLIDMFATAKDLVQEEKELYTKAAHDNKQTEADKERLYEIAQERAELKKQMDKASAENSAHDIVEAAEELISTVLTANEAAANIALLATKPCPECNTPMRLTHHSQDTLTKQQKLKWQCTKLNSTCKPIFFKPEAEVVVLRKPTYDLDGNAIVIAGYMHQPAMLKSTHSRLRESLGREDQAITCPTHLIPMRMLEIPSADGSILGSYHYMCTAVADDGRACRYKVPVASMQQVSATLRRSEGRGILD
ncbi:MAG: hypothetical protein NT086_00070 [Proteobacteria bacterium]|nr:hypothetical protein [Pseudomonadota bacterium]